MDTMIRIRDRFYGVDSEANTFCRAKPVDGLAGGYDREKAQAIKRFRYWRPDLTEEQNEVANNFNTEETPEYLKGDVNVAITAIRIMKEREFLEAVAAGDEEKIAEIERDERGAAMLAEKLGGHQIGSTVMASAAA